MVSFIGDRQPRACDSWFSHNDVMSNTFPFETHPETNTLPLSHTIVTKINYEKDGVTWTFNAFNTVPTINVSIALKNLIDNIFPLSVKIISLTTSSVTIKAYKSVLDINNDIVFSECDTNDIVLHITAGVQ